MSHESEIQRPVAGPTAAVCWFCGGNLSNVGPLVEGEGPEGDGGVYICGACAELVQRIITEENRLRGISPDQEQSAQVKVTRPTLSHLQQRVHQSLVEHNGTLPKESALIWFGYLASLLELELLSAEDFITLLKLLPDYPDDPVVQRILGRGSANPTGD